MENIIVTVTNNNKTFMCDLELPTDVKLQKLRIDVIEALNGLNPGLHLDSGSTLLICNRLGRRLIPEETLESAGVWNGDYLTVMEV